MNKTSVLEVVLKRDRLIMIMGLVTVIILSWIYILMGAGMGMTAFEMTNLTMPVGHMADSVQMMMQLAVWTPSYAGFMFLMWWIMMLAMMLPSASPMILLFAAVNRKQRSQDAPFVPTTVFASGYIIAWGGFSLLATGLQWGLERAGFLSVMMASTSGLFGGLVLISTGIYQLTTLKHVCLKHCRSPFQFVTHHWRPGSIGAFRMGIEHGGFCLLCCWFLMALLFVGGVMNLYWIVGLTIFVLLEKTLPAGHRLGTLAGIGLMVWGGWMIVVAW